MSASTRKFIGTLLLFAFLAVYAFAMMLVAIVLQVHGNKLVEVLYYAVAGLAWVVPAGLLIRWMQRPDSVGPHG